MEQENSTAGLMNMNEAAKYLGKTPAALRGGYEKWVIPYVRFGGKVMFTKEMLDGWIKKNTTIPAPPAEKVDKRKLPKKNMRDRTQPTA